MDPTELSEEVRLEIAARVAEIWSNAIGRPIAHEQRNTYFYALGGHRRLAGRIISEINRSFGVRFAEGDLDGNSWTIAKFSDLIFLQLNGTERSTVVPLRAVHGKRPPLFIVHGVGGNVLGFHSLARHLKADLPVYGIQAHGLIPGRKAVLRIHEMAAQHIEDIQAVSPEGPYNLLGYSYGGLVAYEIAQQLRAAGHQVGFLAMLDTRHPHQCANRPDWTTLHRWIYWRVRETCHRVYDRNDRIRYLLGRFKAQFLSARYTYNLDKGLSTISVTARDVTTINYTAGLNYIVRPYPGELVLFRAEEDSPLEKRLPFDLGWETFPAGLTVKMLAGTHGELLEEPNIPLLAAEITSAMVDSYPHRKHSQDARRVAIEI